MIIYELILLQILGGFLMEYKLSKVDSKSFHNYTFDQPLDKTSVFFGQNGSGKTALSKYIKKLNPEHTRTFDSIYVEENIKKSETIFGTTLIIGKAQIDKSDSIRKTGEKIEQLKDSIFKTQDDISKTKSLFNKQMRAIIDDVKNDFHTHKVYQKPNSKDDPLGAYNLWIDEIDKYKEIKSNFSSSKEIDNVLVSLNNRKNNLMKILPNFNLVREKELMGSLKQVVLKPESSVTSSVFEWLKRGAELHNLEKKEVPDEQICLFCGNEFFTETVSKNVHDRINSEYALLISTIDNAVKELHDALTQLSGIQEDSLVEQVRSAQESIKIVLAVLEKKSKSTDKVIELNQKAFSNVHLLNSAIEMLLKKINDEINEKNQEKTLIGNLTKKQIGKRLSEDVSIKENIDKLNNSTSILDEQSKSLQLLEKKITNLKNENNDLEGFMELVNKTLQSLGLCFKLKFSEREANGFDIILRNNDEKSISASSLSEGEIRLLAFIKFYFSLFEQYIPNDDRKKTERKFDMSVNSIILDDPITSIDSNNRYFLTTLINQILDELKTQNINIFIFTHSLLDFHNFAFRMNKGITRYRVLKDDNDQSYIEVVDPNQFRNYSDEYRSTFNEIVNFALKGRDKVKQSTNYLQFGNKCRFLFETHARTNYNIENVTNASLDSIMNAYEIPLTKRTDISRALDIVSSLSHGISYTLDFASETSAREVQSAARTILWVLNNKDTQHVKAMNMNNWSRLSERVVDW